MQDAAECYWVFIVQRELKKRDKSHLGTVAERETDFDDYCSERDITTEFCESDYKKNMDLVVNDFVEALVNKFPGRKMDIIDVEAEYRNQGLKGDFIITFDDDTETISVSLKNYRGGYDSIQLGSGTWHSFINNFVLNEACGPGMYLDWTTGERFRAQGPSLEQRDSNYVGLNCPEILDDLRELDSILEEVKNEFGRDESTKIFTKEVMGRWKHKCTQYGNKGIDIVISALNKMPIQRVQKRFLERADLCHKEELLLIGKNGDMMCSLFNDRYKALLTRVNNEESTLSYHRHAKSLRMSMSDSEGEILHIDIPFTLQKNGSWYLPKDAYEGLIFHTKENKHLQYGERRPKKSKELSTSTNMWFRIMKYL